MKQVNEIPPLVFWFDRTPRVEAGSFYHVAKNWKSKVYFFCMDHMMDYRKKSGWQESSFKAAEVVYFSEIDNPKEFFLNFISDYPTAIHIFNGFRSKTTNYLNLYIKNHSQPQIVVWSERPGVYGAPFKRMLKRLFLNSLYRAIYWRYNKYVSVLLPLGTEGIKTFKRFGWSQDKMYPFMYVPINKNFSISSRVRSEKIEVIKFLYVGRFSKSTKGIDILISAVNKLELNNWSLDIVGGYGDYSNQTIDWAENKDNVSYIGSWKSDEVSQNMQEYDVVIIPSKFDGWNVVVNESLKAGIGAIVSEQAVSNELIDKSNSGIVFKNNSSNNLKEAMEIVIDNPKIISNWKKNSRGFYHKISEENVGDYLIKIIENNFIIKNSQDITPPWTK